MILLRSSSDPASTLLPATLFSTSVILLALCCAPRLLFYNTKLMLAGWQPHWERACHYNSSCVMLKLWLCRSSTTLSGFSTRTRVYTTFFMLDADTTKNYPAHKLTGLINHWLLSYKAQVSIYLGYFVIYEQFKV